MARFKDQVAARRILDDLFGKDEDVPVPKPARVVSMEVIMRWTRMRWPDGMSFSPLQDGFGWLPKIESSAEHKAKAQPSIAPSMTKILPFERREQGRRYKRVV